MPEDLTGFNLTAISTADKQTLTISTGDITPTNQFVIVAAQTGTADDLDGIVTSSILSPGDADGAVLWIRADAGDTITIRHNQNAAATKNILIPGDASVVITDDDVMCLIYDINIDTNGAWIAVAWGSNFAFADAFTPTNATTDRAFDADSITLHELADVVGTLISDMQSN